MLQKVYMLTLLALSYLTGLVGAEECYGSYGYSVTCYSGCCGSYSNRYCCSSGSSYSSSYSESAAMSGGAIAGTIIGVIIFVVILSVIIKCCCFYSRPRVVVAQAPAAPSVTVVSTAQTSNNMMGMYAQPQYPQPYYQPGPPQGYPNLQQPPVYEKS